MNDQVESGIFLNILEKLRILLSYGHKPKAGEVKDHEIFDIYGKK